MFSVLLTIALAAWPTDFMDTVPSEAGFEGAVEVTEKWTDGTWGYVTAAIPYRDMRGNVRQSEGRLYLSRELATTNEPIPVVCHVYYELPREEAKAYCDRGFAVVTSHYDKHPLEFALADGINVAKALMEWVRRLPIIDHSRVHITGASGGGYMTLAMGAEFFPVAALLPELPPVNWSYMTNYFRANIESCGGNLPEGAPRPLPVLAMIAPGLPIVTNLFGTDLDAPAYYILSAISYTDRITAPTQLVCATGDILCPVEQFTESTFFTLDRTFFPKGYANDFDAMTKYPPARKRFDACIHPDDLSLHVVDPPEGLQEYGPEDDKNLSYPLRCGDGAPETVLPWSEDKQWSLVILNEGSPLPHTGHNRYPWNLNPFAFMADCGNRRLSADRLNAAKLQRLMERYSGHLREVATLVDGTPVNRLNFQTLERLDVLIGLLDYVRQGPDHAERLQKLYGDCPVRPLGGPPTQSHLESLEAQLRERIRLGSVPDTQLGPIGEQVTSRDSEGPSLR